MANDSHPNARLHESAAVYDELMALYRRWSIVAPDVEDLPGRFGLVAHLAACDVRDGVS